MSAWCLGLPTSLGDRALLLVAFHFLGLEELLVWPLYFLVHLFVPSINMQIYFCILVVAGEKPINF